MSTQYATLVLFLAATGLRIAEALAIKGMDFKDSVLHVTRRIYDDDVDAVKSKRSERQLPIDPILMERIETLGNGSGCSRKDTPLNPGNALKRYIIPAAKELGISLGGWYDFRHTLLRRSGVHPKVVSNILGPQKGEPRDERISRVGQYNTWPVDTPAREFHSQVRRRLSFDLRVTKTWSFAGEFYAVVMHVMTHRVA